METSKAGWLEVAPWSRRTKAQKVVMIFSWCLLVTSLTGIVLTWDKPAMPQHSDIPRAPEVVPAPEKAAPPASPSAADARAFIQALDAAVSASDAALRQGDLKSLHQHSQRMSALADQGQQFGPTVFQAPFGSCYGAGLHAQTWWQARVAARNGGVEEPAGVIAGAWKDFQSHRAGCGEAAAKAQ